MKSGEKSDMAVVWLEECVLCDMLEQEIRKCWLAVLW